MTYEEFQQELINLIQQKLDAATPGHFLVRPCSKVRPNFGEMSGLQIVEKGNPMAPVFYLNGLYSILQKGGTIDQLAAFVLDKYTSTDPLDLETCVDFIDLNKVRSSIILRLINIEKNIDYLEDIPYIQYLDLAVIFCIYHKKESGEALTMNINQDLMNYWEVTPHDLLALAAENTARLLPPACMEFSDILYHIRDEICPSLPRELIDDLRYPSSCITVLSNESMQNGSSVLLYPGLLKSMADKENSDLLVIPCSIHELIIIPRDEIYADESVLQEMIPCVNQTELLPGEFLSDHLYIYSRVPDILTFYRNQP